MTTLSWTEDDQGSLGELSRSPISYKIGVGGFDRVSYMKRESSRNVLAMKFTARIL
jgi:hypothetical protein